MKFATFEHNGLRRVGLVLPDVDAIRPIDATDLVEVIAQFDALKRSFFTGTESIPLADDATCGLGKDGRIRIRSVAWLGTGLIAAP